MRKLNWNKILNFSLVLLATATFGLVIAMSLLRPNYVRSATTLEEGLVALMTKTNRTGYYYGEDGFIYGSELSISTPLEEYFELKNKLTVQNNQIGYIDYIAVIETYLDNLYSSFTESTGTEIERFNTITTFLGNLQVKALGATVFTKPFITDDSISPESIYTQIKKHLVEGVTTNPAAIITPIPDITAEDFKALTIETTETTDILNIIADHLDVSRFSSVLNLVDFLNSHYSFGISKTQVVNGKTSTKTDLQLLSEIIVQFQKLEAEDKINQLLLLDYVDLQKALDYAKLISAQDYISLTKVLDNIFEQKIFAFAVSKGYDFLTDYSGTTITGFTENADFASVMGQDSLKNIVYYLINNAFFTASNDLDLFTNIVQSNHIIVSNLASVINNKQAGAITDTSTLDRAKNFLNSKNNFQEDLNVDEIKNSVLPYVNLIKIFDSIAESMGDEKDAFKATAFNVGDAILVASEKSLMDDDVLKEILVYTYLTNTFGSTALGDNSFTATTKAGVVDYLLNKIGGTLFSTDHSTHPVNYTSTMSEIYSAISSNLTSGTTVDFGGTTITTSAIPTTSAFKSTDIPTTFAENYSTFEKYIKENKHIIEIIIKGLNGKVLEDYAKDTTGLPFTTGSEIITTATHAERIVTAYVAENHTDYLLNGIINYLASTERYGNTDLGLNKFNENIEKLTDVITYLNDKVKTISGTSFFDTISSDATVEQVFQILYTAFANATSSSAVNTYVGETLVDIKTPILRFNLAREELSLSSETAIEIINTPLKLSNIDKIKYYLIGLNIVMSNESPINLSLTKNSLVTDIINNINNYVNVNGGSTIFGSGVTGNSVKVINTNPDNINNITYNAVKEALGMPSVIINSTSDLIRAVNTFTTNLDSGRFRLSDVASVANFINGYSRIKLSDETKMVTDTAATLPSIYEYLPFIPRVTTSSLPLDSDNIHKFVSFINTNRGTRTPITMTTLAHVSEFLSTKYADYAGYLTGINPALRYNNVTDISFVTTFMANKVLITRTATINKAIEYLATDDYNYRDEFYTAVVGDEPIPTSAETILSNLINELYSNLVPATIADVLISAVNAVEENQPTHTYITPLDIRTTDFMDKLKSKITTYYGFRFDGITDTQTALNAFNLLQIREILGYSDIEVNNTTSYTSLLQQIAGKLGSILVSGDLASSYQNVVAAFNEKQLVEYMRIALSDSNINSLEDIYAKLDDIVSSHKAFQQYLEKNISYMGTSKSSIAEIIRVIMSYTGDFTDYSGTNPAYLSNGYPLRNFILSSANPFADVSSYAQTREFYYINGPITADRTNEDDVLYDAVRAHISGLGYNIEASDKENVILKILTSILSTENNGAYGPNAQQEFSNDDYVMLNNHAAKTIISAVDANPQTVENIYLQFGQKFSEYINGNVYLSSLGVTATLNGRRIVTSSVLSQTNGGIPFPNANNVSINQYWFEYLDLHNVRSFDVSSAGTIIQNPYGYYEYTFTYAGVVSGTTPKTITGTYTMSFYLLDESTYVESFPAFVSETVEQKGRTPEATSYYNYNELDTYYNYNQTEEFATLLYNPSLYNITINYKRGGTHSIYSTSFSETIINNKLTGNVSVFKDGTVQQINTPLTTKYFYTNSDESTVEESSSLRTEENYEGDYTVLVATMTYGNGNAYGNGALTNGTGYTYRIELADSKFYPINGTKLFADNSFYPTVALAFTENGEYDVEMKYLLSYKKSLGATVNTYEVITNSSLIFARNYYKYYDSTGAERNIGTESAPAPATSKLNQTYDTQYKLHLFGVDAFFNKKDVSGNKLELRDYKENTRSDFSYILQETDPVKLRAMLYNIAPEQMTAIDMDYVITYLQRIKVGAITGEFGALNQDSSVQDVYDKIKEILTIETTTYIVESSSPVTINTAISGDATIHNILSYLHGLYGALTDSYEFIIPLTDADEDTTSPTNFLEALYEIVFPEETATPTPDSHILAYILDAWKVIPFTNVPPISFTYLGTYALNSGVPTSTYKNLTTNMSYIFTKDSTVRESAGLYVVTANYTYANYSSNAAVKTQTFIFRIHANDPEIVINTGDHNPLTGDYTNKDVYVKWAQEGYFEAPTRAEVSRSETYDTTASNFATYTYTATTSASGDWKQGATVTGNGYYRVRIYYGPSGSSYQEKYFYVDKHNIDSISSHILDQNRKAVNKAGNTNTEGYSSIIFTDSPFTIAYDKKLSGAKITTQYQKIPFSTSTEAGQILSRINEDGSISNSNYVTNNMQITLGNISALTDYKFYNEKENGKNTSNWTGYIGGDIPLSNIVNPNDTVSGIYIFTMKDQAGNTSYFYVVYDLSKAFVNVYEQPDNEFNIISTDTTLFWGTHKAIKITDYDTYSGVKVESDSDNTKKIKDFVTALRGLSSTPIRTELQATPLQTVAGGSHAIPANLSAYGVERNVSTYLAIQLSSMTVDYTSQTSASTIEGTKTFNPNLEKSTQLLAQMGDEWNKGERTYTYELTNSSHDIASKNNAVFVGKLQMNFDNARGIAFASTASAPTGNSLNIQEDSVFNAGQLRFSFLPGESGQDFEVEDVSYSFYALDVLNSLSNSYAAISSDDLNNASFLRRLPLYPFVYTQNSFSIYNINGNTTAYKGVLDSTITVEANRWISKTINATTLNGNEVSRAGMYVFKRTYTQLPEDSLDTKERYYVFYVDRSGVIELSAASEYFNGYAIGFQLGTVNPTTFDAIRIQSYLNQMQFSLFTTNKLPVELRIPEDKYNTAVISNTLTALPASLKNTLVNRNNGIFALGLSINGIDDITSLGTKTTAGWRFTDENTYGNVISTIATKYTDSNGDVIYPFPTTQTSFSFGISTSIPKAVFSGKYDSTQQVTFNTKSSSATTFQNSNNKTLIVSFDDTRNEFSANIDYKNIDITLNGTSIYKLVNGVLQGSTRYSAYTFRPLDISNSDPNYYVTEGGKTYFKVSDDVRYLVNTDGSINVFNEDGTIKDILRQATGVRFRFSISVFDQYSPQTSVLSEYNIEGKVQARLQFEGSESDFVSSSGSYFYGNYSIIIDRTKPQQNLINLIKNEIAIISSKLYPSSAVYYENNAFVVKSQTGEIINNAELNAAITKMTSKIDGSSIYDYVFTLDQNFNFRNEPADEDKESTTIYARRISDINNYVPTITPDEVSSNFIASNYVVFNYTTNILNIFSALRQSDWQYVEIVEKDQAGNYRTYLVYCGDTSPTIDFSYVDYLTGTAQTGRIGGGLQSTTKLGKDLQISNLDSVDLWGIANVTITTYNPYAVSLSKLFTNTPSILDSHKSFDLFIEDINNFIKDKTSSASIDGYTIKVEFINRNNGRVYTWNHTVAGNELSIETVDLDASRFKVVFGDDTTNTTLSSIQAELYTDNRWQTLSYDNSIPRVAITSATREYTFVQGLYKFTLVDNFGRRVIQYKKIGITDRLVVSGNQLKIDSNPIEGTTTYYSSGDVSLEYQSNLQTVTISVSKYNSSSYSTQNIGSSTQKIIRGTPTVSQAITSETNSVRYETSTLGEGMKKIRFINESNYDIVYYTIELKYENGEDRNIINIVFFNIFPTLTLTDTSGNEIAVTRFLEKVNVAWPNIQFEGSTFMFSATTTRNFYAEDGSVETYIKDNSTSFMIEEMGNYSVRLKNEMGGASNKQYNYTYVGGSGIVMYQVYTMNKGAESRLSQSPYSDHIMVNTKTYPVYTYFSLNNFYISSLDPTGGKDQYLSVRANAEENLTVSLVKSVYNGYVEFLLGGAGTINLSDKYSGLSNLTYNIYRIHGQEGQSATVYEEYIIVFFVSANEEFAKVSIYEDNNAEPSYQSDSFSSKITLNQTFANKSLKISWEDFYLMDNNIIYCDYYYNGEKVATVYEKDIVLSEAGKYKFIFYDLAGNRQSFPSSIGPDQKSYELTLSLVNNVVFSINSDSPIPNYISNEPVVLTILNTDLYKRSVAVSGKLNGKDISIGANANNQYIFSATGYYEITLKTIVVLTKPGQDTTEEKEISTTYKFIIVDKNSSLVAFNLPQSYNLTVERLLKGNEDITYRLNNSGSLWIAPADGVFGIGTYTITLSYTHTLTGKIFVFSFSVWINDEIPAIVSSIPFGTSTTDVISIYFNPKLIYEMIGNSTIEITGHPTYIINSSSPNEKITIELTQNTTHWVKIYSADDKLISSYKLIKNEPLNTTAIIIIIAAAAFVIILSVVFIVIRTKLKFR